MAFSPLLSDFFLDVEIKNGFNRDAENSLYFEGVSLRTNEDATRGIYVKCDKKFDIQQVKDEIGDLLSSVGHPNNKEIINSVIILFGLMQKQTRDRSSIEVFFNFVSTVKLKQYLFFRGKQAEKIPTLKFHDFYIGSIDLRKLMSFISQHSGSDFAERYSSRLSDKVGIEIKSHSIISFDIHRWGLFINDGNTSLDWTQKEIIDLYLEALSNYYLEEFRIKFKKQQEFINSYFGLLYSINDADPFGGWFVNVFYGFKNDSKAGWVLPLELRVEQIKFPDPRIVQKVNSFFETNEAVFNVQSEFSRYLDTLCGIFSNAEKHILSKNYNSGFMDFFVGLDFLLAPNHEKSGILKNRISLLAFDQMGRSFTDMLNYSVELYAMRSDYVHNGRDVGLAQLIDLRNICRIVLSCIVNMIESKKAILAAGDWVREIDTLVVAAKAGVINKRQLASVGVKASKYLVLQKEMDKWSFE